MVNSNYEYEDKYDNNTMNLNLLIIRIPMILFYSILWLCLKSICFVYFCYVAGYTNTYRNWALQYREIIRGIITNRGRGNYNFVNFSWIIQQNIKFRVLPFKYTSFNTRLSYCIFNLLFSLLPQQILFSTLEILHSIEIARECSARRRPSGRWDIFNGARNSEHS